jgi:hypothetical protein
MRTLTMLLAAMAAPAMAAPEVIVFDPSAPFNPWNDTIRLTDLDPNAPDVRLSLYAIDPGGGSNAAYWIPQIVGGQAGPEVESNIGAQATSGPSGGYGYGNNYDELPAGSRVSASTPGPWGVANGDFFSFGGGNTYPLELLVFEGFPFSPDCQACGYVIDLPDGLSSTTPGIKYVGIRWEDDGQTYYGWVALRVELFAYPDACVVDDPFSDCDPSDFADLIGFQIRYIAAAYETEPDTPITAGGGLCQADMNFDAALDFFDLAEFLRLYNAEDPAADLFPFGNGDQIFNFYDLSTFISLYEDGCAI